MSTNTISRLGESLFEREILAHYEYTKIESFSDHSFLQKHGVDYIIDPCCFVELKARSKTWGDDFLVETAQGNGPGWLYAAHSDLLCYLWLDTQSVAVIDFPALKSWLLSVDMGRFKEVTASNQKGEISKSRIIPFHNIDGIVPYRWATLPLEEPWQFLVLNRR
jgi:hypothetical protein